MLRYNSQFLWREGGEGGYSQGWRKWHFCNVSTTAFFKNLYSLIPKKNNLYKSVQVCARGVSSISFRFFFPFRFCFSSSALI